MSFHLYTKNNLTDLAKAYFTARNAPGKLALFRSKNLFEPEVVVIPTQGMQIWLEHYLVKEGEVVANRKWPRIQEYVNTVLSAEFEKDDAFHPELFTRDVLLWRILRILRQDESEGKAKKFAGLYEYLHREGAQGKEDGLLFLRQYQLSSKLAELFDRYLCFLPDVLADAENADTPCEGETPEAWQKRLWWELCRLDGLTVRSPASRIIEYCNRPSGQVKRLKAPVTTFGVSAMSVWFLKLFQKMATNNEVHFFYHNICDEFWGDQDRKLDKRLALEENDNGYEQFNNSLLCKFGELGRRFFNAFMDADLSSSDASWEDRSVQEDQKIPCWSEHPFDEKLSLLHAIQRHVRTCTNPPKDNVPQIREWDDSLTVHRCHNPKRQVEELQNALLWLIQKHKYKLTDILVMAPDISQFAPIISSVLDKGPLAGQYTVSDKSIRHTNLMAEAFLAILEIGGTRFEVNRILNLLDAQPLRNRFGLKDADITDIRDHLSQMRVRWGINASTRKGEFTDLPEFDEYTWEQGLDRMLLSLAEEGSEDSLGFGELAVPQMAPSGDNRHWLGALCHLFTLLRKIAGSLNCATNKKMPEWLTFLHDLQNSFFQADADSAWDSTLLRQSIDNLASAAHTAGCDDLEIPLSVIQSAITSLLESVSPVTSFLGGKLTFCSMQPMRGIPCKVIAILGLDERSFPRQDPKIGFNLLAIPEVSQKQKYLRYYDRDRTVEDRYIFLETLLAAQDYLLLFYKGLDDHYMGEHGNHPPATPVEELLEYAERVRKGTKGSIVVDHRLNPYDRENFRKGRLETDKDATGHTYDGCLRRLFSFDYKAWHLAKANPGYRTDTKSEASEQDTRPAFVMTLGELPEEERHLPQDGTAVEISITSLYYFLKNPQRHFLMNRLGFPRDAWEEDAPSDYEPFKPNKKEEAILKRTIGRVWLQSQENSDDKNLAKLRKQLVAESRLPVGKLGEQFFDEYVAEIRNKNLNTDVLNAWNKAKEMSVKVDLGEVELTLPSEVPTPPNYKVPENPRKITVYLTDAFLAADKDSGVGIVEGIYTTLHGRHYIRPFLRHLALIAHTGESRQSYLIDSKKSLTTIPGCDQATAMAILKRIVQLYYVNMQTPLPIFSNYSPVIAKPSSGRNQSKESSNDEKQTPDKLPKEPNEWKEDSKDSSYQLLFPTDFQQFLCWYPTVLKFAHVCYGLLGAKQSETVEKEED